MSAGPLLPRIVLLLVSGVAASILVTGHAVMLIRQQTIQDDEGGTAAPVITQVPHGKPPARRNSLDFEPPLSPRTDADLGAGKGHLVPATVAAVWGGIQSPFHLVMA